MDSKFDKYMNKILTAIEKPKIEKMTPTPHIQQSQNSYFPTQPSFITPITPHHIQTTQQMQTLPLSFADPRFSYTPQTQHLMSCHQELANGTT